jgi:hypothetical protein
MAFGMGVAIDSSSDSIKVNNERGGPAGNLAEDAMAMMNGTYCCDPCALQ